MIASGVRSSENDGTMRFLLKSRELAQASRSSPGLVRTTFRLGSRLANPFSSRRLATLYAWAGLTRLALASSVTLKTRLGWLSIARMAWLAFGAERLRSAFRSCRIARGVVRSTSTLSKRRYTLPARSKYPTPLSLHILRADSVRYGAARTGYPLGTFFT